MGNKKLDYISVTVIENGFMVKVTYDIEGVELHKTWEEKTYYCETLDQVKDKLEEILK
jgi:hypothetical protein